MNTDKKGIKVLSIIISILCTLILPLSLTRSCTTIILKNKLNSDAFIKKAENAVFDTILFDGDELSDTGKDIVESFEEIGIDSEKAVVVLKDEGVRDIVTDVLTSVASNLIDETKEIELPTIEELRSLPESTKEAIKEFIDIDSQEFVDQYNAMYDEIVEMLKQAGQQLLQEDETSKIEQQSFEDINSDDVVDQFNEIKAQLQPLSFTNEIPFRVAVTAVLIGLIIFANWKHKKFYGVLAINFTFTFILIGIITAGLKIVELALAESEYAEFIEIISPISNSFIICTISFFILMILGYVIQGIVNKKAKKAKQLEEEQNIVEENQDNLVDETKVESD